jgi:hypothetical protein
LVVGLEKREPAYIPKSEVSMKKKNGAAKRHLLNQIEFFASFGVSPAAVAKWQKQTQRKLERKAAA